MQRGKSRVNQMSSAVYLWGELTAQRLKWELGFKRFKHLVPKVVCLSIGPRPHHQNMHEVETRKQV